MANISFIGAGKAAYSISKCLADAGYSIKSIISRSVHSAKDLAGRFEGCKFSTNYLDALAADLIFISTGDEQIGQVAAAIAKQETDLSGKLFVHLSGVNNIDELKPLAEKGGETASLHIMQTFPSKKFINLTGSYASVETGNEETAKKIFEIAENAGLKPFRISSEMKVFYHLAGVFASNMIVGDYSNAQNMFAVSWEGDINPAEILKPIMQRTIDNLTTKGIAASLSGPVERGDLQTIEKHIEHLRDNKLVRLNYISGSLNLLEIAFKKGSIDRQKFEIIRYYLRDELKKTAAEF